MKTAINIIVSTMLSSLCNYAYCQMPKLIDDHFKALKNHDVKAIAAGYADDAQVFSPNWEGAKNGPAGLTEVYSRYFSSSPDLVYNITNIIAMNIQVLLRARKWKASSRIRCKIGKIPAFQKFPEL